MKVRFITDVPEVSSSYGKSKALLEVAGTLRARYGVDCDIVRAEDAGRVSLDADVVDFDHDLDDGLWRNIQAAKVARVQLLDEHVLDIPFKVRLRDVLARRRQRADALRKRETISRRIGLADCVLVQNADDDAYVRQHYGCGSVELVYPIPREEEATVSDVAEGKTVGMISTFDPRKGCWDLVRIHSRLCDADPDYRLALWGAKSWWSDAEKIKSFFPKRTRDRLEVVPRFDNSEKEKLLSRIRVGLSTSYLESFGLGPFEMAKAGRAVVGYACPGLKEFLPAENLIDTGDWKALAERVEAALNDRGLPTGFRSGFKATHESEAEKLHTIYKSLVGDA